MFKIDQDEFDRDPKKAFETSMKGDVSIACHNGHTYILHFFKPGESILDPYVLPEENETT
jgi:hypothetical protein